MATLRDFAVWVTQHTPAAADTLIEQGIQRAARDFARRTNILQLHIVPTLGVAPEFNLTVPADTDISRILSAGWGTRNLQLAAVGDIRAPAAHASATILLTPPSGPPTTLYQNSPTAQTVRLWPMPSAADMAANPFFVVAAVAPTSDAVVFNDILLDDYNDAIAASAIAWIMRIPGQVFTNPVAARDFHAEYEAAVVSARRDSRVGRTQTSQRVQPRRFA
jgi:hypothetical protein